MLLFTQYKNVTHRCQQYHCLAALPAQTSVFNNHTQVSHSVISNNPDCQCCRSPTLPPKMITGACLMAIYKKKFSTSCYISRPNGLQNKISQFQTQFWQNQARNQVLRFGRETAFLWAEDFCVFHMFKTNFSEHNKIRGDKKIWG